MTAANHIGNWRIHQDSPDYGCTDNPSFEWLAFEEINGHWTGRTLKNADRAALEAEINSTR